MFYDQQNEKQKDSYKKMLSLVGKLSGLYSESNCPYLPYRCHENIFCKYFQADNIGRVDCSADAKKDGIGIGLKTWTGNNDQKIAEFGKLREQYKNLTGIELVKSISKFRNDRIRVTVNTYGLNSMVYHIVKRVPGGMQILEHKFDYIDVDNIKLIPNRGNNNNTYFTDGNHTYHFSESKNTLYMIFDDCAELDNFEVEIIADPFDYLLSNDESVTNINNFIEPQIYNNDVFNDENKLCLRLYSVNGNIKFVGERSGLNQWNAKGRVRNSNEVYIPFPAEDRKRNPKFFPDRNMHFKLHLPDGKIITAKVCQSDGKAIMSNPNKDLGEWLLRKVLELPEQTILTYDMLECFGIDCVVFTKKEDEYYIDFGSIGTYEKFYKNELSEDTDN